MADDRRERGDEHAAPGRQARTLLHLPSFLAAALVAALSTTVAFLAFGRDQLPDVVMLYLLGIMLISSRYGFAASIFAAFVSVAAFNFFFVPPYFTLVVGDLRHAVTFAVMFLVAVVISGLTQRVRNQAAAARDREQRTLALYELSRELAGAQGIRRVIEVSAGHLENAFASKVSVFTSGPSEELERVYASGGLGNFSETDMSIGRWVWSNQKEAGLGTAALSSGTTRYVPLVASAGIVGVLGLTPDRADRFDSIEQRRQADAFAAQMALAIERAGLAEETEKARREVETEQLRSSLLSSVSHDLRTPLAVITGAASTLVDGAQSIDEATRLDLMTTILEESERLNRLIRNLLDMTRLESGTVKVNKEWLPLEEIVGAALNRLESRLATREVKIELPANLPLIPCDAVLIEQALINLLENAAKYGDGPIEIRAALVPGEAIVEILDRGPGIPPGQEARIFDKFQRAVREGSPSGVGLGLAICRAIVGAHAGSIWAQNREGGGAVFSFALPVKGEAPSVALAEDLEGTTR
jgi:two-component system, OmpR family, sensor histidine kinase KdpD